MTSGIPTNSSAVLDGKKEAPGASGSSNSKNIFLQKYPSEIAGGGTLKYEKENLFNYQVLFRSEGGDIIIGSRNIFEDSVCIYNKSKTQPLIIGNYNHFKIGSRVEASHVGNFNDFGMNSYVDSQAYIENANVVGTSARVNSGPIRISKNTVSFNGTIEDNFNFNEDNHKKKVFALLKVNLEIMSKKHMKERGLASQVSGQSQTLSQAQSQPKGV